MTTFAGTPSGGGRPVNRQGAPDVAIPPNVKGTIEAGKTIYSGTMGGFDAAGFMVDGSDATNPPLAIVGVFRFMSLNTTANGFGAAGAISNEFLLGGYSMLCTDGSITATTQWGTDLFCVDNQTVSTNDGGGARLRAGYFGGLDDQGNPFVVFGVANPYARNPGGDTAPSFFARAVVTSLAAYAGSGTGTLTASATGAFGTQDGVSTLAVGDVVFIPEGTTNLTAAKDAGPWTISVLGAASPATKWVLTRPGWWFTGDLLPAWIPIEIGGEGAFWYGTEWKSFAAKGAVVDTTAPALYPGRVAFSITLSAGTKTISGQTGVPIFSAASGVSVVRTATGGTVSTTIMYAPSAAPTPGVLGTASLTIQAEVAAGTIQNTDTSVLTVTITNW